MANEEIRLANIETVMQTAITLFIEHGIENTTREMIARASGLSRRSTERYFPTKTDCVVRVAEWFGKTLYDRYHTRTAQEAAQRTAAESLMVYFAELKRILLEEPRIYVCYAEFKAFLYRNSDHRDVDYRRFMEAVGCRKTLQTIFELGREDGTIRSCTSPEAAARYLTNTIMAYFSNAVLLYDTKPDVMVQTIDDYIADTWNLYCGE